DHDVHGHGTQHRYLERHLRPVPHTADLAAGRARRHADGRRGPLHDGIGGGRRVGLALGFWPDGGPLGVVAAVGLMLVFAFSLSWVWTAIGLNTQKPETVMQLSMTILFPLTFASN